FEGLRHPQQPVGDYVTQRPQSDSVHHCEDRGCDEIARRIEQISGELLQLNQGTLYPALLRMEQEGWIPSKWGASEKNRKAKFYSITAAGRRRLAKETEDWRRMSSTIERFLGSDPGSLAEGRE